MVKKREGAGITAKVEGVDRVKIPLKAVVYTEEKEEIKILAETTVKKEEFELDLGVVAEDLPETAKLAIVPQEVKHKSFIRRLSDAGYAPTATIRRDLMLSREGRLTAADLPIKAVDDVARVWPLKRRVCGRVIKRDPVTDEVCFVPGATVRVLDVDIHLLWWYPYLGHPWCWLFPWAIRREEIATTTTDECGRFCIDIPYLDIDAILRWRLRFHCLPEILRWPRVIDAIDLGVKPDLRVYPELERLPELEPKPRPEPWPDPGPLIPKLPIREFVKERGAGVESEDSTGTVFQTSRIAERVSKIYTEPRFEPVRQELFAKRALFEPVKPDELSVLEQPAFPKSIAPPALPEDETLLKILPDKTMLPRVRRARPIVRLLRCWAELVPEWRLFLDVPDIVFKVEQDIDGDGALETIYDQGYFDVNWNLSEPTMNVTIEAWPNAICVPCGAAVPSACTPTGIVGISDMPGDLAYLNAQGYAVRVNRPKLNGARLNGETPFCKTVRLVGCHDYGGAAYYKVFYSYEGGSETHFNESWYVYNLSAGTSHHVVPDAQGFYPVLTPPNDFFPYYTLINWRTYNYPNGRYTVRLALYDAAHNPIGPSLPSINVVVDNSKPSRLDFLRLRYKVGTGAWQTVSLHCPIIYRSPGADIELEITYNVAATHLRDFYISFVGCGGYLGSETYWHKNVNDNNKTCVWTVTIPGTTDEGGYRFYLEGRSRAFNGVGGLATDWYFDPLEIRRTNNLHVVILDS